MTYPNERIPELVQILRDDPTLRPGRRCPHHRGGHPQVAAAAGQVAHPQDRRAADQPADPGPELRAAGVPPRRSRCPTCGCCRPGSPASRRSRWRSCRNQHDIKYVPIDYAKRAGTSKFHFVRDAYRYILQVLRMVMYFDPLKVLMPPALWLLRDRRGQGRRRHGPAPVLLPGQHRADLRHRHDHRVDGAARRPGRPLPRRPGR